MACLAQSARKLKSSFRGRVEIFCEAEFFWAPRRGIPVLAQMELKQTNSHLWQSYELICATLAICSAVRDLTVEHEPNPGIWELLLQWSRTAAASRDPETAREAFNFLLLKVLGWGLDWGACSRCGVVPTGNGAAADYREGALLCPSCSSGAENLVRLNRAELDWLRKLDAEGMTAAAQFPESAEIGRIKRLRELLYRFLADYDHGN